MRIDVHPFKSAIEARAWARLQVDAAAAATRARFVTVIAGQELAYAAKYAEACAVLASDVPQPSGVFPWLEAEAFATGLSLAVVARRVKDQGGRWQQVLAPRIEALRVAAKSRLDDLQEIADLVAEARAAKAELEAITE